MSILTRVLAEILRDTVEHYSIVPIEMCAQNRRCHARCLLCNVYFRAGSKVLKHLKSLKHTEATKRIQGHDVQHLRRRKDKILAKMEADTSGSFSWRVTEDTVRELQVAEECTKWSSDTALAPDTMTAAEDEDGNTVFEILQVDNTSVLSLESQSPTSVTSRCVETSCTVDENVPGFEPVFTKPIIAFNSLPPAVPLLQISRPADVADGFQHQQPIFRQQHQQQQQMTQQQSGLHQTLMANAGPQLTPDQRSFSMPSEIPPMPSLEMVRHGTMGSGCMHTGLSTTAAGAGRTNMSLAPTGTNNQQLFCTGEASINGTLLMPSQHHQFYNFPAGYSYFQHQHQDVHQQLASMANFMSASTVPTQTLYPAMLLDSPACTTHQQQTSAALMSLPQNLDLPGHAFDIVANILAIAKYQKVSPGIDILEYLTQWSTRLANLRLSRSERRGIALSSPSRELLRKVHAFYVRHSEHLIVPGNEAFSVCPEESRHRGMTANKLAEAAKRIEFFLVTAEREFQRDLDTKPILVIDLLDDDSDRESTADKHK